MPDKINTSQLTSEVAVIKDETLKAFEQFLGYLPNPDVLAQNLENEGNDVFEIFEKMLLDGHIWSQLSIRKAYILSRSWDILPEKGDEEIAEFVRGALNNLFMQQDLEEILTAIEYGYSVTEIIWELIDGMWYPKNLKNRDPERFRFNSYGELLIKKGLGKPERLNETYKFIVYRHESRKENPYGTPVLSRCYWPWLFKKAGVKFWVTMCEKFGVPSIIALFQSTEADGGKERAAQIAQSLQGLSNDAAAAISNVDEVKTLESSGEGGAFDSLIKFCNIEISKAITGQILSSDIGDQGSYALAKTHEDTLEKITVKDGKALERILNETLIKWIVELNYGVNAPIPKLEFDYFEIPEWEVIKDAIDRGFPISKKALYSLYNLPEPEDENDVFVMPKLVQGGELTLSEGAEGQFYYRVSPRLIFRKK